MVLFYSEFLLQQRGWGKWANITEVPGVELHSLRSFQEAIRAYNNITI